MSIYRGLFDYRGIKNNDKNIAVYLMLILALWVFSFISLRLWLQPYSLAYEADGVLTAGYVAYVIIGMLFTTPAPFVAVLIMALAKERMSLREFFRRIFRTENKLMTVLLTAGFCALAFAYALINGEPNGEAWYMMLLGFIVMIPFVGIAEEAGWRGLLQPALERKFKFPFAVFVTAVIWDLWHFDLWLDPSSNHYGDSMLGFSITIFIWAFALAALYKATESVMACAVYHAFVDALGAVYDWNLLFDACPGNVWTNVYRILWLAAAVALWKWADQRGKEEKRRKREQNIKG